MSESSIIEADLTWTGRGFERGIQVELGDDGRIGRIGAGLDASPTLLRGKALLPGMVNAHSHAFQRGLRGRGEQFPEGAGSFWSWREAMYGLVEDMDDERIYALSRQAFGEMLAAGITSVGEFHYLHHDSTLAGYAFDEVVLRAAADAGIRIALLEAFYRSGGIDEPLAGAQRRFGSDSVATYVEQLSRLRGILDSRTQSLGIVAHSIRAADPGEITALHRHAVESGMVFHIHVEEQQREIEASIAAYGKPPMAVLDEHLSLGPETTAVHCTHTDPDDLDRFVASGATVCICPLTEANLGDGLADVGRILAGGGRIALGSDSNARISLIEEARWLEYGQRLKTHSRGCCVDEDGRLAEVLWSILSENGARSIGIDAGRIETGALADLITVDLDAPSLLGWEEPTLLAAVLLGGDARVIADVCVDGRWVVGGP